MFTDINSQIEKAQETVSSAIIGTNASGLGLSDLLAMAPAILLALLIFAFLVFITEGEILEPAIEEGLGWLFRKAREAKGQIWEGAKDPDGNSL
ncbi:MAG TPA: hypothetical protein VN776_08115 [Terracidiphilus sp.]|nr:hypothetical protein [Terracidiphilus sp.]